MKIAIATNDKNQTAEISDRGGRAPYYLIFDEKGKLIETIKNPFVIGGGGAGFAAAKLLADKGVKTFVAGNVGPNMEGALEERNVNYQVENGTVKEIVDKLAKK